MCRRYFDHYDALMIHSQIIHMRGVAEEKAMDEFLNIQMENAVQKLYESAKKVRDEKKKQAEKTTNTK